MSSKNPDKNVLQDCLSKVTAILINDEWKKVTDLIKEEDDG